MSKRRAAPSITELSRSELEVLKPLWERETLSAREVHEAIEPKLGWAYTTTRTMLDRLVTKGHVARKSFHGINVYSACIPRVSAVAGMVRNFARSVLEIDPSLVVPLFAKSEALTEREIAELEEILEREGESK